MAREHASCAPVRQWRSEVKAEVLPLAVQTVNLKKWHSVESFSWPRDGEAEASIPSRAVDSRPLPQAPLVQAPLCIRHARRPSRRGRERSELHEDLASTRSPSVACAAARAHGALLRPISRSAPARSARRMLHGYAVLWSTKLLRNPSCGTAASASPPTQEHRSRGRRASHPSNGGLGAQGRLTTW